MRGTLRRLRDEERGASLVEYALLVALIAVVCIAAVTFVGSSGSDQMTKAGTAVGGEEEEDDGCEERDFSGQVHHRTPDMPPGWWYGGGCP